MRSQKVDFTEEGKYLDSLVATLENEQEIQRVASQTTTKHNLFSFDPNTATKDEFLDLGFSGLVASRIINYRSKGGKFKIKNDLRKIYGMDSIFYEEVKSFIQLPDSLVFEKKFAEKFLVKEKIKNERSLFDLNLADTSQLKSVYGIGEKLSLRIIKYRESLGGFVYANQLKAIFGLDSTVVENLLTRSFISREFQPDALNLNSASEQELDKHPYINKTQAKAIVAYRFQHGKFTSVDELKNIRLLERETIDKLLPYLKIK